MRKFEKISFNQFKKDIKDDIKLYEQYSIPVRKTPYSCGYDFIAIEDIVLKPGKIVNIPTGIKAKINKNEFIMIVIRSSLGFKYNIRLCNQVGIIDADYYDNSNNEGHMWVALQNEGDETIVIHKGEGFSQAIITRYYTCGDVINGKRNGGFGSTNKEER